MKTIKISAVISAVTIMAAASVSAYALPYRDYLYKTEEREINGEVHYYDKLVNTSMFIDKDKAVHILAAKHSNREDAGRFRDIWMYDIGSDGKAAETDRLGWYEYANPGTEMYKQNFYNDMKECTEGEFESKFTKYDSMTPVVLDEGMFSDEDSTNNKEISVAAGESVTAPTGVILKKDSALKLIWKCSDTSVAEIIEDGKVKGLKPGIAEITGTIEGMDGPVCKFSVNVKSESELN